MKRTFWALKVAPEVETLIRQLFADLPELRRGIRLVPPENVHITLKFLGDTEEQAIDSIITTVKAALMDYRSFPITISGTGTFPNPRQPRVVFLDIKDGLEKLREISNIVENCMEDFGYSREKRVFTPHLTIGRVKEPRLALTGVESLLRYQYDPLQFVAREVLFYESNLTPQGALYTSLANIFLK